MTVALDLTHPLDALYAAARRYPGGIEALAARMQTHPQTLYKKFRQGVESHQLHFDGELSEILFCLAEAGVAGWADVIKVFCWRHGFVAVAVPEADMPGSHAALQAACEAIKTHAAALQAYGQSIADGKVDAAEMADIEARFASAAESMAALLFFARAAHAPKDRHDTA